MSGNEGGLQMRLDVHLLQCPNTQSHHPHSTLPTIPDMFQISPQDLFTESGENRAVNDCVSGALLTLSFHPSLLQKTPPILSISSMGRETLDIWVDYINLSSILPRLCSYLGNVAQSKHGIFFLASDSDCKFGL